ncbi:hypothetical protein AAEJ74_15760 [Limnospira fusiformis PMC 851.14]|uniref:Uncharacterized protein n=1 Tax=Limnospira fusiformis PMC 851.14 TaxID=2219512 RepID=A0ABU9EMA4_LIMFS
MKPLSARSPTPNSDRQPTTTAQEPGWLGVAGVSPSNRETRLIRVFQDIQ